MENRNNLNDEIEFEALRGVLNKRDVASVIVHGREPVELKKGEKRRYLGQFRERVLKVLNAKQMAQRWIYPDIIAAINDSRSTKVIVRNDHRIKAKKYTDYAKAQKKLVTITNSPDYIGNVVLVVAADDAVDVKNIAAGEKTKALVQKGLTKDIIKAGYGKLCGKHYRQLVKALEDTNISLNFQRLSLWDRLLGEECSACNHGPIKIYKKNAY